MRLAATLAMAIGCVGGINKSLIAQSELLTIGSAAPSLNVEHWVQNGQGKFKPVTKFEPNKVYVVEFWATWCGPCIASMPHLAELQKAYADKGVQIVSISDEDLETVESFLEREVREVGEPDNGAVGKKTYRDVTSAYCLTTDPDQSSYRDYMEAAAQNGIPTAFIVGKDAKIEWLGHPMEMDGPLEAVVADSWDRKAYAEEVRARQEAEKAMQDIFALLQKEDYDGAVNLIDELSVDNNSMQMKMLKLQVLVAAKKSEQATAHIQSLYKELEKEPAAINMIAWNIYESAAQGRIEDPAIINASIAAAEAAVGTEGEEKASLFDTLAHLYYVQGNLDKAIELETQASKLTGDRDREFIENFLKELREEKAGGKSDKEEPK
jgi:thiol-disulfide isomerase/thioredoxin